MKPIEWKGSSYADLCAFPKEARHDAGYQLERVQGGEEPADWKPMPSIGQGVREICIHEQSGEFRVIYLATRPEAVYVLHGFQKKKSEDEPRGFGIGHQAFQDDPEVRRCRMKAKKRAMNEHDTKHITPAGRSALLDLAASDEDAVELQMRSTLLRGLERWLASSDLTQIEAAKVLGITQARVSDLKRGKISQFSLDMLIRLATRAGLHPTLKLAA
jgi:phage-related protein/predicted XRE-type DNA-binding protein